MGSTCYLNSCPEAVSTVTINQTIVEIDGAEVGFTDEVFAGSDVVANQLTLTDVPTSGEAVILIYNGVVQPQTQWSITGAVVTLGFAVVAADVLHFHYLATL